MKIVRIIFALFIVFILIKVVTLNLNDNDFRVATLSENGITLRSVSFQRKMDNLLTVGKDVPMWVPRGMGWYQSGKINKLLIQEKKQYLANETLFYNFGYIPDIVVSSDPEGWLNDWNVVKKWGILNYLRYRFDSASIMQNKQEIEGDLVKATEKLDEIIQRDFSDNRLLQDEIRVSVYNGSQVSGVATMVARNLEWAGLTVVGVQNYQEATDVCKIVYGSDVEGSYGYEVIKQVFSDCQLERDQKLTRKEIELYLGDSFASMINYQSYQNN